VLLSVTDCASGVAAAELSVIPPLLLTSEIDAGSVDVLAVIRIAPLPDARPLVTWIPPFALLITTESAAVVVADVDMSFTAPDDP
jgi:hypothetical protein